MKECGESDTDIKIQIFFRQKQWERRKYDAHGHILSHGIHRFEISSVYEEESDDRKDAIFGHLSHPDEHQENGHKGYQYKPCMKIQVQRMKGFIDPLPYQLEIVGCFTIRKLIGIFVNFIIPSHPDPCTGENYKSES